MPLLGKSCKNPSSGGFRKLFFKIFGPQVEKVEPGVFLRVEFADVRMLRVVKLGTKRPPSDFL